MDTPMSVQSQVGVALLCMLPGMVTMVLYLLVEQHASRAYSVWVPLSYVMAAVHCLLLMAIIGVSLWAILSYGKQVLVVAPASLAVAVHHAAFAVYLLARRRPRLLFGWSLGSIAGAVGGVALAVYLFWGAFTWGGHLSAGPFLLFAVWLPVPAIVFSLGPLVLLPLVWLWVWLARKVAKKEGVPPTDSPEEDGPVAAASAE